MLKKVKSSELVNHNYFNTGVTLYKTYIKTLINSLETAFVVLNTVGSMIPSSFTRSI